MNLPCLVQVLPTLDISPADAVKVQLDALQTNDEPWCAATSHPLTSFAFIRILDVSCVSEARRRCAKVCYETSSSERTCVSVTITLACRPKHGLQTMYEWAEDVGGLDRSRYFGRSLDLYHFDHFQGASSSSACHVGIHVCRLA